jgi:hypothetical protein
VVVVAELKNKQIGAAEDKVDGAIQQHQVNVIETVFKGIEFAMPVVAEQDLQADDEKVQRCADQQQYLFFEAFHGSKILDFF